MKKIKFDVRPLSGTMRLTFVENEATGQLEVTCPEKRWVRRVVCVLGYLDEGRPVDPKKISNLEEFCKGWMKIYMGRAKTLSGR